MTLMEKVQQSPRTEVAHILINIVNECRCIIDERGISCKDCCYYDQCIDEINKYIQEEYYDA